MTSATIDGARLTRWLNARKMTPSMLASRTSLELAEVSALLEGEAGDLDSGTAQQLCEALDIKPSQLQPSRERVASVLVCSSQDMLATRRAVWRGGIHFYNYYSLPAPTGHVAPVILDILCPQDRVPTLNNGHLEPAITVNLGPGSIHGRWGEALDPLTWQVLDANHTDDELWWIVGASYTEPSFCPHSYSLVSSQPARIISYTAPSGIAELIDACDHWPDGAFHDFADRADERSAATLALAEALARRGHDSASAAAMSGISQDTIETALSDVAPLGPESARALARALGLDHRLLLAPEHPEDALGRSVLSVKESKLTVRRFRSYVVASLAAAANLPDIVGLFMRVQTPTAAGEDLDLQEQGETHYLVTSGRLTLQWTDDSGDHVAEDLTTDDAAWVGPYVPHRFSGDGALVKLGHGGALSAGTLIELSNTFQPAATLQRARRDHSGWGFDEEPSS
jgi:transcriptional regulator with XRE-family HTH domain